MTIFAILLVTGVAAGTLNAIAANGNTVMVAVMAALGFPATATVASVRIPSLVGYGVSAVRLMRARVVPWRLAITLSIPVVIGAGAGAGLGLISPEIVVRIASLVALVLAAAVLMLGQARWDAAGAGRMRRATSVRTVLGMLAVGLWGGYVVIAAGAWVLMVLVLAVYLPGAQANAVKALAVAGEGLIATAIVVAGGSIRWDWVLPLTIGSALGALAGARLVLREGSSRFIYWTLLVVTVVAALEVTMRLLPQ